MYRMDYHLHSEHSMDCDMPIAALCEAALAAGLDEVCITEHTEMGHPDLACDMPPSIPAWFGEIEAARRAYPRLTIRAGIEIGDNPLCRDRIKAWHLALPLDFMLLSLHLIDNADPYFPGFFDGKAQEDVYRRYAEQKLESILAWSGSEYDAVAHLGYCAKFAPYPLDVRPLRYHHAPDAFDALFAKLAADGKALEVNASGYRTMGRPIPGRDLLLRFREKGGEFVTLGSDAHRPEHVGAHLEAARALAIDCGFTYALAFEKRKPIPIKL